MDEVIKEFLEFVPKFSDSIVVDVVATVLLLLGVILFKILLVRIFRQGRDYRLKYVNAVLYTSET